MTDWHGVASGTRLWRTTLLIQLVLTAVVSLTGVTALWSAADGASQGPTPNGLMSIAQLLNILDAIADVAFGAALVWVGARWKRLLNVPGCRAASSYHILAIIHVSGLVLVAGADTIPQLAGIARVLSLARGLVAIIMLFVALSLHEQVLRYLDSPKATHASALRTGLIILLVALPLSVVLVFAVPGLGVLCLLGAGICALIWLILLVIFLGNAAAVFEAGPEANISAFD